MRLPALVAALPLALLACTPIPESGPVVGDPIEPLPLLGGYRDPADQCVRVGENAYTNQFLGDASDFVGCPIGYEGTGVFVTETGAILVAEAQGYQLYSVPVR